MRWIGWGLAGLVGMSHVAWSAERRVIDLPYVESVARALAEQPYVAPASELPEPLAALDYDEYRKIRFNPNRALWREQELPFRVEFFHPGGRFGHRVRINEFTATHVQEVPFTPDFFDYGDLGMLGATLPPDLGYTGFRVLYPINRSELHQEFAVFLGASYFRVIGRNQVYGISARGLAINTGLGTPEEFPLFREFWLGKPEADATSLTIYAVLDSASAAGAYRLELRPGATTTVDVEAVVFFRNPVEQVGLAPFSSMFYFGENTLTKPEDFRGAVHDSDGLLIQPRDGAAIWRPLINPRETRTSLFDVDEVVGFGLLQRDRNFENYQDIEAAYHLRPSAWVTPGEVPAGTVMLFEYSTDEEAEDNVALIYRVDEMPPVGEPLRFSYQLAFDGQPRGEGGVVRSTRAGRSPWLEGTVEIVVDFEGERLAELSEVESVSLVWEASGGGEIRKSTVRKNPFNQTWRAVIYLVRTSEAPVEMSAYLELEGERLTETWSYQWVEP